MTDGLLNGNKFTPNTDQVFLKTADYLKCYTCVNMLQRYLGSQND